MNKQIDEIREMAKIIAKSVDEETLCDGLAGDSSMACLGCDYIEKEYCKHHLESATGLYNKGYRKASEIFAEIDKLTVRYINDADYTTGDMILDIIELKKKCESEGVE